MKIIPDGVNYFYGYPGAAEKDHSEKKKFYNNVPFETVERKVASRMGKMGCEYLNFESNKNSQIEEIYDLFEFDLSKQKIIDGDVEKFNELLEKDKKIKKYLIENFDDESVYQAQPFSDLDTLKKYVKSNQETLNMNDKLYMDNWIPQKYLGERSYKPYQEFPFMAKLSRSSAGDATFLIKNEKDLKEFQQKFKDIKKDIPIFYEKLVKGDEYGIEFFRSYKGEKGIIKIIESMVDDNNSYMGGIVKGGKQEVPNNISVLMDDIFKHLDSIDWYGWGGIDIIVKEDGSITVIDPNIRVTQIMGPARDSYTNNIKSDMLYKSFEIDLNSRNRKENLNTAVKDGLFKGYSGTIYGDKLYGDGGILFDTPESLQENRNTVQNFGITI